MHYEGLIRAQVNVDDVVDDLSSLSRQHRDNPLVFRILGDGLMRQGKLQQALDTYRQALNQL
jgi:predicted negative regulator of RcsB-dependent stress response